MSFTNTKQCTGLLTGDTIRLVNVLEPLRQSQSPRFASFALTGRWFQHRRRETRAFAFQGRCFVVARRGKQTRLTDRLIRLPDGGRSQMAGNCRGLRVGVATRRHHKAPSTSGRELTQQMGLHGPHPYSPAATTNRYSRPGVGGATGARGARARVTGLAHVPRQFIPHGTWSGKHRSGYRMEKVNTPGHPAAALEYQLSLKGER